MKKTNIMLDIETLGCKTTSAMLSIGAVMFDINTGEIQDCFHHYIDLQDCLNYGLTVDASTIIWWLKQSDDARKAIYEQKGMPLKYVLSQFTTYFNRCKELGGEEPQIWGNGASFDVSILQYAYEKLNMEIPWSFYNVRDVRTAVMYYPEVKANMEFEGIRHDALDDCKYQIKYLTEITKRIVWHG